MITQHFQTTAALGQGLLRLNGLIPSPYMAELNGIGTYEQEYSFIPAIMKAVLLSYTYVSGPTIAAVVGFQDGISFDEEKILPLTGFNFDTGDLVAETVSVILAEAVAQSYTISSADIIGLQMALPIQAAITNCPADATTNYNVVTTLLGSLTGAVNTANTKQNQIATQLNSLLGELRTLGLIAA